MCRNFRSSFNVVVEDANPGNFTIETFLEGPQKTTINQEVVNIVLAQQTSFEYSSAEGLLYDTSKGEPLSLLTSNEGERVLKSMFVTKKFVPSVLEDGANEYSLYLQIAGSAAKITVYRQDKCLIPMGEVLSNE